MILAVFAVYDSGVQTWMAPLFMRNKGEALRWWQEICNDEKSKVALHPKDYTLFELGTWDDDKCKFDLLKAPSSLGMAIEFIKMKELPKMRALPEGEGIIPVNG